MNRNILMAASGSFMALSAGSLAAQESPPTESTTETTVTTAEPAANGNGAAIVRQDITVTTTTPGSDGTATVIATSETGQTVATPHGNTTTMTRTTDIDGTKSTEVEHARGDHPGHHGKPGKDAEEPEAH